MGCDVIMLFVTVPPGGDATGDRRDAGQASQTAGSFRPPVDDVCVREV